MGYYSMNAFCFWKLKTFLYYSKTWASHLLLFVTYFCGKIFQKNVVLLE
jgi:hypothetical protein